MPDKYLNEVLISPGSPEVAAVVMMSLITRPRPAPPRNLRPVWSLVWAAAVWGCTALQPAADTAWDGYIIDTLQHCSTACRQCRQSMQMNYPHGQWTLDTHGDIIVLIANIADAVDSRYLARFGPKLPGVEWWCCCVWCLMRRGGRPGGGVARLNQPKLINT